MDMKAATADIKDGTFSMAQEKKQLVLFLGGSQRKHDYMADFFKEVR